MPLVKPLLEMQILTAFQKMSNSSKDIASAQKDLAKDLADAIDKYIKSATIIIPPGQASQGTNAPGQLVVGASPTGPVTGATTTPQIVPSVTVAPSPPAQIS